MGSTLCKLDLNDYNICLLSVNDVIHKSSITTINNLNSYEIDLNLSKHIVKKFIHSDLIHTLCEETINCSTVNKVVWYYNVEDTDFGWLNEFFDKQTLVKFITTSLKMYNKVFPLTIFNGKVSLLYINDELQQNNEDIKILLNQIKLACENKHIKTQSFKKAKQFIEKYELKFLSSKYFTTVKSKQIMYK